MGEVGEAWIDCRGARSRLPRPRLRLLRRLDFPSPVAQHPSPSLILDSVTMGRLFSLSGHQVFLEGTPGTPLWPVLSEDPGLGYIDRALSAACSGSSPLVHTFLLNTNFWLPEVYIRHLLGEGSVALRQCIGWDGYSHESLGRGLQAVSRVGRVCRLYGGSLLTALLPACQMVYTLPLPGKYGNRSRGFGKPARPETLPTKL